MPGELRLSAFWVEIQVGPKKQVREKLDQPVPNDPPFPKEGSVSRF